MLQKIFIPTRLFCSRTILESRTWTGSGPIILGYHETDLAKNPMASNLVSQIINHTER